MTTEIRTTADVFKLASDPTRLSVLLTLKSDERFVNDLCDELKTSQPALSHHLALLRVSRVIEARRDGKHNYYGLTDTGRSIVAAYDAINA